jgi:DNA-binding GntR family transcriptional regulator
MRYCRSQVFYGCLVTLEDKRDRIDHAGRKLVWRQVADDIRADIEAGKIPAGARMASETELVEQYGVSRVTVRRAIKELADDGILDVVHGRGTYVRD